MVAHYDSPTERWNLAQRVVFRFGFVYALLYCLPFPLTSLPYTEWLSDAWQKMWWKILPWVGEDLLGIAKVAVGPNGSGDTTADYVMVLVNLTLTGAATVVWSAIDRRRPHYRTLLAYLRIYLRYVLALTMFSYGFAKVLPAQFPAPTPNWLLERYGQSSPMRLLWLFMGSSPAYTIFAGATEVLGGVLLLSRRTTLLGALVLIGVVGNVMMLNYCYDVPVKLYSSHLFLMACFLAAPDARRLLDFFVRNRATEPADLGPRPTSRRWRRGLLIAKVALLALTCFVIVKDAWDGYTTWGNGAPSERLAGIYEPHTPDRTIHFLTISRYGWTLWDPEDNRRAFKAEREGDVVTLTEMGKDGEGGAVLTVIVVEPEDGQLLLSGSITGSFTRVRDRWTLLPDRGFHWINEVPYNR